MNEGEQLDDMKKAELAECFIHPKIIITTRSELFSRDPKYIHAFLPTEADNKFKDTVEEARENVEELRFAPFNNKLHQFMHATVAFELRAEFESVFGALQPVSSSPAEDDSDAVRAMRNALTAPHTDKDNEPGKSVELPSTETGQLVAVLASALRSPPSETDLTPKLFAFIQRIEADESIWLFDKYRSEFEAIPELRTLINTPVRACEACELSWSLTHTSRSSWSKS